jgi:GNAT superfamily N-acetyltransferase
MAVSVRSALPPDLPRMMAIKHDAGLAAWQHILPPEVIETLPFLPRWSEAIASPDPRTSALVAEVDGRVLGFAITRPSGDADASPQTGELDGFYADPGAWGIGAGRALLAAATDRIKGAGFADATLWTAAENHRPRRIYEVAGWRVDGTERQRSFGGVELIEVRYRLVDIGQ